MAFPLHAPSEKARDFFLITGLAFGADWQLHQIVLDVFWQDVNQAHVRQMPDQMFNPSALVLFAFGAQLRGGDEPCQIRLRRFR